MDTQHMDTALAELQSAKTRWARLSVPEKIGHLDALRRATFDHSRRWVEHATKAKGLTMNSPLAGEEWIAGPFGVIDALNSLEVTLSRVGDGTDVLDDYDVRIRPNGQVVVDVMPATTVERLLFSGSKAEVWMDPSVTEDSLRDHVTQFYSIEEPEGAVCAVM
jgi:aldehyde dehydrogenase (NAD(P)+)